MKLRKGNIVSTTAQVETSWFYVKSIYYKRVEAGEIGVVVNRAPYKEATDEKPKEWQYCVAFPARLFDMMVPESKLEKLGQIDG